MPFSIPEMLNVLLYAIFVIWAARIFRRGWSPSITIALIVGAGLVGSDLLEHYVSETSSIIFSVAMAVSVFAYAAVVSYLKKKPN